MIFLRSVLFNVVFYLNLIVFLVLGFPFFFTPRLWSMRALQCWARVSLFLLRLFCNIRVEIRNQSGLPSGPVLIACKHQSLFETFALLPLFNDPAMVLKRELTWIPLFGWFAVKFAMISVDRSAGAKALRGMTKQAKAARALGREIIIFPEGTRKSPGSAPDYKPGVVALYRALDLPCIPIALNSGHFWPRRTFVRYPGTIVIEVLKPIEPGLPRAQFMRELEGNIEKATNKLAIQNS